MTPEVFARLQKDGLPTSIRSSLANQRRSSSNGLPDHFLLPSEDYVHYEGEEVRCIKCERLLQLVSSYHYYQPTCPNAYNLCDRQECFEGSRPLTVYMLDHSTSTGEQYLANCSHCGRCFKHDRTEWQEEAPSSSSGRQN